MGNPLLNSGLNLENDINYNIYIYIYNWGIFTCQVWFPEGKCWFPFIALLVSRIIILEIHHQPSFTCSESHLQQSTWWTKDKGGTVAFNQFNPFSVRSVPQEPQKNIRIMELPLLATFNVLRFSFLVMFLVITHKCWWYPIIYIPIGCQISSNPHGSAKPFKLQKCSLRWQQVSRQRSKNA